MNKVMNHARIMQKIQFHSSFKLNTMCIPVKAFHILEISRFPYIWIKNNKLPYTVWSKKCDQTISFIRLVNPSESFIYDVIQSWFSN